MFSQLPSSLLGLSIFDLYSEDISEMEEGPKFYKVKSDLDDKFGKECSEKMGGLRFLTIHRRKL